MKKKIQGIASLLFGLMFINAGLNKFFNYMPTPQDIPEDTMNMFIAMMEIGWLLPLVAVAEIIGGVLFLTNRYRALGALILCPIMTGILIINLAIAPEGLPIVLVLLAVLVWVMIENRNRYLPLIQS